MRREGGQATVEWVALVLLAALVLTGAATLTSGATDRNLGELVAKRIARPAAGGPAGSAGAAAASAPRPAGSAPARAESAPVPASGAPASPSAHAPAPGASAPAPGASAPAPSASLRDRAVAAFWRLRGVARLGRHAWIVCIGYRRWRHELAHPSAPNEPLPLHDALDIANDCLNPHAYLFED